MVTVQAVPLTLALLVAVSATANDSMLAGLTTSFAINTTTPERNETSYNSYSTTSDDHSTTSSASSGGDTMLFVTTTGVSATLPLSDTTEPTDGTDHNTTTLPAYTTVQSTADGAHKMTPVSATGESNTTNVSSLSTLDLSGTTDSNESSGNDKNELVVIAAAAAAGGVALTATIIVVVVVVLRRKRQAEKPRKRMFSPEQIPLTLFDSPRLHDDMQRDLQEDSTIYMNVQVKSHRIPLAELGAFVQQHTDTIKQEYKELPSGDLYPCTVAKKVENKALNRFQNIHPYDRTRVVLPTDREQDDDEDDDETHYGQHGGYINASFIDGYCRKHGYIATQGPLARTINDFWTMIWSENCSSIVMLTSFIEEGKRKCEEYYPRDRRSVTYGAVTVELVSLQSVADYAFRSFKMTKGNETREIHHFHFLSWPDHGVPSCYAPFLMFRHKILALVKWIPGPIVVHCSAGIGRTGAYIAVDYLLNEVSVAGSVDVLSTVTQLRQQRPNMVQNQDQYLFIYGAVLSGALTERYILSPRDMAVHIQELDSPNSDGTTKLATEFELVCSASAALPSDSDVAPSLAADNAHKNRDSSVLTLEPYRPFLTPSSSGNGDYINAVFCNGFRRKNEFIATQVPLSHTVDDFWRLIIDHDCEKIILMHDVDKDNQYWPDSGTTLQTSLFTVVALSEWTDAEQLYTLREFEVKSLKHPESSKRIQHGQLHFWPYGSEVPRSAGELLSFLEVTSSWQTVGNSGNSASASGATVVQCMNGADYSGLFIAAVNLIERFKDDTEFDVFHTVEMVKMFRPQFISNKAQYLFLYTLASAFLDSKYPQFVDD